MPKNYDIINEQPRITVTNTIPIGSQPSTYFDTSVISERYRTVPCSTEPYQMVPNGAEGYGIVLNVAEGYGMVPNVADVYRIGLNAEK